MPRKLFCFFSVPHSHVSIIYKSKNQAILINNNQKPKIIIMAKDLCSPDHHHHHHLFPKVFCVYYHHHRRPQIIIEPNQAKIVIIIINNNSTKATIISISATKYWSSIENENNLWKKIISFESITDWSLGVFQKKIPDEKAILNSITKRWSDYMSFVFVFSNPILLLGKFSHNSNQLIVHWRKRKKIIRLPLRW